MNEINAILGKCELFRDTEIAVSSVYRDDPEHKCVLVVVRNSGTKYKVRVATQKFPTTVAREYLALQWLDEFKFEWLPRVVVAPDRKPGTPSLLVCEYFEGDSLDKCDDLTQADYELIVARLVRIIGDLQLVKSDWFGDFEGDKCRTWSVYFRSKFDNHVENALRLGVIDEQQYRLIAAKLSSVANYLLSAQSSFLHFDIKPANIIYDKHTGRTALVDFELCRFGDAMMEYARIYSYERDATFLTRIAAPVVEHFLGSEFRRFKESDIFALYQLYNLLGYRTVGIMKYGLPRTHVDGPIQEMLSRLST